VRRVRKDLELAYRSMLDDALGTIYPHDPRSLNAIVTDVRAASRELRPTLLERLDELASA
jgi:hypothetical protein